MIYGHVRQRGTPLRTCTSRREREKCVLHTAIRQIAWPASQPASQQFRALKAPRVRAYFYKSKLPLVHILSAQQHISIYFVQTTRKFGAQRTTYIFHFLVKKFTNKFRGTFMVVLMVMGGRMGWRCQCRCQRTCTHEQISV